MSEKAQLTRRTASTKHLTIEPMNGYTPDQILGLLKAGELHYRDGDESLIHWAPPPCEGGPTVARITGGSFQDSSSTTWELSSDASPGAVKPEFTAPTPAELLEHQPSAEEQIFELAVHCRGTLKTFYKAGETCPVGTGCVSREVADGVAEKFRSSGWNVEVEPEEQGLATVYILQFSSK